MNDLATRTTTGTDPQSPMATPAKTMNRLANKLPEEDQTSEAQDGLLTESEYQQRATEQEEMYSIEDQV